MTLIPPPSTPSNNPNKRPRVESPTSPPSFQELGQLLSQTTELVSLLSERADRAESSADGDLGLIFRGLGAVLHGISMWMSTVVPSADVSPAVTVEDEYRARSVVIERLPELDGKPSHQIAGDQARVEEMMDLAGFGARGLALFRMGKAENKDGSRRHRLLKVIFPSRTLQRQFLANSRKIRSSFPSVFVRPSLTEEERAEAFRLRQEKRQLTQDTGKLHVVFDGVVMLSSDADKLRKEKELKKNNRQPDQPRGDN